MDFAKTYGIHVNPVGLVAAEARLYVQKVNECLTWIDLTKSGRILLRSIKLHGRPVEVRPYTKSNCNAEGGGEVVHGSLRGYANFSPSTFSLHGACPANATKQNSGLFRDEILYHELVHVFRNVSSRWSRARLLGGLYRYDNSEEFLAVVLTNIYIADPSNRIKTSLRADHKDFSPQAPAFSGRFGIFSAGQQVAGLVKRFIADNHGYATRIANDLADVPFNPIRDYLADPGRAEDLSNKAVLRDLMGSVLDLVGK
jgi:hypothetical protein